DDERPLGDERDVHGQRRAQQDLEAPTGELIAALGRLVRIRGRADGERAAPWTPQLRREQRRDVHPRLDRAIESAAGVLAGFREILPRVAISTAVFAARVR